MSHDSYEEYLKRGGVEVDPARVMAFTRHVTHCPTCHALGAGDFAYLDCPDGLRLAREASRPINTIDKPRAQV